MAEIKNILIEATNKTPQIDLNHLTGELIFSGKSIPENAADLYEKILKWVSQYSVNPRHTTNLRLNLEYFNTASSIWLAKIVKVLCTIKEPEAILMVHLYFNIEEFDNMEVEDLKDALSPVIDLVGTPTVSLGIKIYGTDDNGEILKESMVLI
ncbi:MAG: SiaC family regulatory phosphoprotein [Bacteroidia bacterium]|nr:SiaC family regulatory phosphoprotein [Bacteroidia bacterium]